MHVVLIYNLLICFIQIKDTDIALKSQKSISDLILVTGSWYYILRLNILPNEYTFLFCVFRGIKGLFLKVLKLIHTID